MHWVDLWLVVNNTSIPCSFIIYGELQISISKIQSIWRPFQLNKIVDGLIVYKSLMVQISSSKFKVVECLIWLNKVVGIEILYNCTMQLPHFLHNLFFLFFLHFKLFYFKFILIFNFLFNGWDWKLLIRLPLVLHRTPIQLVKI